MAAALPGLGSVLLARRLIQRHGDDVQRENADLAMSGVQGRHGPRASQPLGCECFEQRWSMSFVRQRGVPNWGSDPSIAKKSDQPQGDLSS